MAILKDLIVLGSTRHNGDSYLGTVKSGTWNGSAIGVPYGGTGATSFTSGAALIGAGTGAITTKTIATANTAGALVARDSSGNFSAGTITATLSGNSSSSTKSGVSTIWMYPENGNEINFGGTNSDSVLYFGYRAKDSRPIPTQFRFGGSGTASLIAGNFIKSGSSNSYILLGGGGQKALSDLVDTSSSQTISGIKRFNDQINSNGCIHQYGGMKVKGRAVHYGTFQVGWDPDNTDDATIATKFGKVRSTSAVQKGAVKSIFYGTITAHNNVTIDKHLSVGGELEVDSRARFYSTVDHLGNDVTGIQSLDVNGTVRFSDIKFLSTSSSPTIQFLNSDGGCIRNARKIYTYEISMCGGYRDDGNFISIQPQDIKPHRGGNGDTDSFFLGCDGNPWNKLFVYQARVKTLLLGNRALGVVDGFKTTTTSEAVILTKLYWNDIANYWPVVHIRGSAVISSVPKEIDLRLMFNQFSSWRVESSGSFNPKVFIFKEGDFIKIGLKGFTASQIQLSVDVEEDSHGVIGIANKFTSGNSSNSDLPIFCDRKMKLLGWDILYYNSATIPSANGSTCYEVQYGDGTQIALTTSEIQTICTL